jgi:type II secretory pathway component GspD/PulD (secretin)
MTASIRFVGCAALAAACAASLGAQSKPLQPLMVVRLDPGPAASPGPEPLAVDPGSESSDQRSLQDPGTSGQLTPLAVSRLDEPGASATLDSVRPFSLRLSEQVPIRDVLLMLVRDTGLSLVIEPGIDAQFMGELKEVSLRQALDLVLRAQGLDYSVERTAIRVFPRRAETRIFDVNVAAVRRSAAGETTTSSSLPDGGPAGNTALVRWAVDRDEFDAIGAGIQSLLSPDGRFAVDRAAGVAQVTDYPDRLDRVGLYLESVDRRLRRQVDIDARVVEVTLGSPTAAGVDWAAAVDRARTSGSRGAASINFEAFLKALGEQGTVAVLASPRLNALHNEPALMRIGIQDVTFVREVSGGEDETVRIVPAPVLDGFTLAVTAHITADGMVTMNVAPSVTQRTGETRAQDRQSAPVLAVGEWATAVRLHDGETLVLPGLRRDRDRQVTSESRGLLGLFRREQVQSTHSELAVLLTPRIRG